MLFHYFSETVFYSLLSTLFLNSESNKIIYTFLFTANLVFTKTYCQKILSTFPKSKHEKNYKIGREVPFYKNMS